MLLRSTDNCQTWQAPEVVSFRSGSRDGMPVPLCLQNGKSLVFAIEDNGLNGTFKPVIIHSSVKGNWTRGTVTGSSSHRWSALSNDEALATSIYAGAPYLIQLATGETLLSCQSAEGRTSNDYPIMQVYVGNTSAKNFQCRSTPFPFIDEPQTKAQWCAMTQTSDTTVMATASVENRPSQNGIWIVTGHIFHPMKALYAEDGKPDWPTLPVAMFLGAESQAQAKVRTAWNADSLYVHFDVADKILTEATENSVVTESDAVELLIDRNAKGRTQLATGTYRIACNIRGESCLQRGATNQWSNWTAEVRLSVERQSQAYSVDMAVPWSALGGKPASNSLALSFRLHNNDGQGAVFHEDMSGSKADNPKTWLRLKLDSELCKTTKR